MGKLLLLAVFVLSGCNGAVWSENRTSRAIPEMLDPVIYKDRGTGCEYLSKIGNDNSLTPRIASDGKSHMGCKQPT